MSENNKSELELITTEAELLPSDLYDFDFIVNALGLIPYQALGADDQTTFQGALSPGAIINLELTEEGDGAFTLHGGEEIVMNSVHLTLFEKTLKQQIEQRRQAADAEIKRQAELRIQSELNAANQAMANAAMIGKLKGGLKRNS